MEEDLLTAVTDKELPGAIVAPLPSLSNRWTMIIMIITMIIIMITRPKPAYGRQGLAGSGAKIQIKRECFGVFLTTHFAPPALSSDIN